MKERKKELKRRKKELMTINDDDYDHPSGIIKKRTLINTECK